MPQVYLPGRRGSLQIELMAATRRSGRIAYETQPRFDDLLTELADGRPVLVLQNLGFRWMPRWHYAVVVGYRSDRQTVILRSGTRKRLEMGLASFQRSWLPAGGWGLLALVPGEIPASAGPTPYLAALLVSEPMLEPAMFGRALQAGAARWPEHADLNFALANQLRQGAAPERAADYYRRALAVEPGHVGVLNNYADLLREAGCPGPALGLIDRALGLVTPDSPMLPTLEATRREIAGDLGAVSQSHGPGESCAIAVLP